MVVPPLQILLPKPDNIVGPGAQIELISSLVGPQPTGTVWDIQCLTPPVEVPIWQERVPWNSNDQPIMLGSSLSQVVQRTLQSAVPEGTSINVEASLIAGNNGQVVDTNTVPAKWSPTTGLGIQQLVTQTTAVLDPDQAAELSIAATSSVVQLPQLAWPTAPQIPLWEWVSRPFHHGLFARRTQHLISGDGAITINSPGAPDAYGCIWSFITVPAGFGRIHGILPRYDRRVLELGTVVLDFGLDTAVAETREIDQDGGQWIWNSKDPQQLLYSVTPGCEVLLTFYSLFGA